MCGISFAAPKPAAAPTAKPKREPRPKAKNDPKLVAAARELRDRWMEEVNSGRYLPESQGKYEVSRQIAVRDQRAAIGLEDSALSTHHSALPLLPAA